MKLEKGDRIIMWDGSNGLIVDKDENNSKITIDGINIFRKSFHIMNIRFVNGIEMNSKDLEL